MTRPGWYSSPQQADTQQYWDGAAWTGKTRAVPETPEIGQTPERQTITLQPATAKRLSRIFARIIAGFILFVSGILLFISVPALMPTLDGSAASRVQTTGTVSDFAYSTSRSGKSNSVKRTSCAAMADFTVDGTSYRAKADIYISPCPWTKGETVDLSYDPKDPATTGVVQRDGGTNIMFAVVAGVGVAMFAAGLALFGWSLFGKTKDAKVTHPSEYVKANVKDAEKRPRKRNKRMDMNGS